ncbi:CPBP family intramembrane metalloprotease [Caldibacillus lycopersici]|uniref:CPBP family intramembrane metalloprotease n=1 Tax=Perspicuibacillus lycopersici TaxID=1325689 RepID=A0AAE3LPG8_9BACI|nr:CPBP family intramembrane glutamic endopeptidase [Perspicuibacillus lycopersici]MCU9614937.1 CPBP family intramembrane metalloprotease [Perspicuibacillus lycopersici]
MEYSTDNLKNKKKEVNQKDAIIVFSSFTFICVAIIFSLIVYDVFTIQNLLSFGNLQVLFIYTITASIGLLLFGIILSLYIPAKLIDDTNKSYQSYSLLRMFIFLLLGALFEELLFRGIMQNLLFLFFDNQWISIIITTFLFVAMHTQYFKKPIMLLNITIPGLIFGWIYFETNNIVVPIVVHFIMNFGITLLFKYDVIRMKR